MSEPVKTTMRIPPVEMPVTTEAIEQSKSSFAASAGSARLCECGRETTQPTECMVCQQERVLRAAPELLSALEELLFAVENADETGYVTDCGFINLDAIHANAHAAIEKARGPNVTLTHGDEQEGNQ